ncbi:MAG: GmrSD restriction endonuclease domain-containing protein, partial [Phycisphaerae bacterium]
MKASETKLQKIIEGTNQYVVPLFQRTYSWGKREWKTLWDDLMEIY